MKDIIETTSVNQSSLDPFYNDHCESVNEEDAYEQDYVEEILRDDQDNNQMSIIENKKLL